MTYKKPNYDELEAKLAKAETIIHSLENEKNELQDTLQNKCLFFRKLIDALPVKISYVDSQQKYQLVNKACEEFYNVTRTEIEGRHVKEILGDKAYQTTLLHINKVLSGENVSFEDSFTFINQLNRYKSVNYIPHFNEKNEVLGFFALINDITEQKQIESALRESEELYRLTINNISDAVFITDDLGKFTFICSNVHIIFGYSYEEVNEYHNIFTLFNKRFFDINILKDKGEITNIEEEITDKFGTTHYLLINIKSVSIRKGTILYTCHDITDRKIQEKSIRDQAKILEMLFKHSLDCIVLLDKDFNFIRVNEAYARSCQKNVLDFPGHNHFEFYPSILLKEFEEVVKTHKHYEAFSRPFTFPDHPEWGVTYWDLSLVPVINDKNDIELLVFTLRDVTDRKLAEDEKDKIQAQLVQSQKMEAIGSLSGGIAHDFNNLLTPLLGYTKLLMAKIDKNDGKFYYLNEINSASERAAHITQSLLLFSRKQTTKYSTININNQINSIYDMINYTIGENIVIEKELEKNLYNIQGNGSCIDQIIMNLAINSKKAMEHGGKIVIKTENLHINDYNKKKPPGDYVCLSVMDTGKGFDEQIKEQIFEPFFTTDNSGSGFGLYIVKCIVQQHNGWIDVQSTLNKGTTFKFFFPASFEDLVSVDKQLLFSNELRGNGEKILLVEDEKIVLNFAALALRDYGYTIYEATNSKEAEEIFKNEGGNFHLIFSDVILPDKIATFMIEDFLSLNNNIKILLTSGYIEDESQWYKIVQKKYHFLQKPYNLIDLLSIIKNIIHSKEKIYGTMQ